MEDYVEDERVFHYYDENEEDEYSRADAQEWQPAPPSVASASLVLPAKRLNRRPFRGRSAWKLVHAPKMDASGKITALWEEEGLRYVHKTNNFIVAGIDCLQMVKRLKDCWLDRALKVKKKKNTKLKQIAMMICYADKVIDNPEECFDRILKQPWVADDQGNWDEVWANADEREQKDALKRADGILQATRRACIAEAAFEKIEKVETAILDASTKEGLLDDESRLSERQRERRRSKVKANGLVEGAATVLQSAWRGCRTRQRFNELAALELAELEASLANDTDPERFRNRDQQLLEREAGRRAAVKLELLLLEEMNGENEEEERRLEKLRKNKPLMVQLPPGQEVAWLCTKADMGYIQETMDAPVFEMYVNKLWRLLCLLRGEITRSGPTRSVVDFEVELRQVCESWGGWEDDRVSRTDLATLFTSFCPSFSTYEIDFVCNFLDRNMNGLISVQHIAEYIRGSLSDRRCLLCNYVYDELFFNQSPGVLTLSGRLDRLTDFYKQFAPEEVNAGRPEVVHRKYKDTEKVNQELFKKLYAKYAPWLDPPEYLWNRRALRQEQELRCIVDPRQVIGLYSNTNSRDLAAVDRTLSSLDAAVKSGDEKMRRSDWLMFHAQLGAGIRDDSTFEQVVCNACGIDINKWLEFAERVARRELVAKNREKWMHSIAAAERQKMSKLKESLPAAAYENYVHDLENVLRKIRGSLVRVCGTHRNDSGLQKAFEAAPSFGDDRKVNAKDFRATLARYGISIDRKSVDLLVRHYGTTDTGYVCVDGLIHGLQSTHRQRVENGLYASEIVSLNDIPKRRKRWLKAICSTIIPESQKEWIEYFDESSNRKYWYCRITKERTWDKPKRSVHREKENWEKSVKRRIRWSLQMLEKYRTEAHSELDVQLDIIKNSVRSALPLFNGGFESLPKSMFQTSIATPTSMFLDGNSLDQIPRVALELIGLQRLSVVGNQVRSINSDDLALAPNIQKLVLSRNKLDSIPNKLGEALPSLKELQVDHNEIAAISESLLLSLHEIEILNFESNRLWSLPNSMDAWSSVGRTLKWVILSNNQLAKIPIGIGESLVNCTHLDLRDNRFETLPDTFGKGLGKCTVLSLQGNNLSALPQSFSQMDKLEKLYLQHNKLEHLPENLSKLTNLRSLHANNNCLVSLPERLGDFHFLEELYLQGNCLSRIPPTFSHLNALEECWLHQNNLEHVPRSAPQSLRIWKLHNNQLKEIHIGEATELTHLDLAGNQLTDIPTTFYKLHKLEYLRLDNNPFKGELLEVVKTGKYRTVDEENYGLLLAKLVDGLKRTVDLQGRIDMALGVTVAEALKIERTKVTRVGNHIQQCLGISLERFSEDKKTISQKKFQHCMQVIGTLLSTTEVDRITARVFHIFDPEETESIEIDRFVMSVDGSNSCKAKKRDVAGAILRFCTAQKAKLAYNTLSKLNQSSNSKKKLAKKATKRGIAQQESEETQVKILSERNAELDKELLVLKRQLAVSREQARVVEEHHRQTTGGLLAPRPASPVKRKKSSGSEDTTEKDKLRTTLREKNREIQQVKRSLLQTRGLARHYNESLAEEYKQNRHQEIRRRKRHEQKNLTEREKNQLRVQQEKKEKIKAIFLANARSTGMLSKGDMIAAAGEFYRCFGGGRLGLDPKQWREKLLLTVNQAFESGYRSEKTGRYVAFDKDENGQLSLEEFYAFCKQLEKRLVQQQQDEESAVREDDRIRHTISEQKVGSPKSQDVPNHHVLVDFLSSGKPIVVPTRKCLTVAKLKAKIEFTEAIPVQTQILIFRDKRLDDNSTLEECKISTGDTIKLIIAK